MAQESIHAELEQEIQRLAAEIKGKSPAVGREVVQSALREHIAQVVNFPVQQQPSTSSTQTTQASSVLPAYAAQTPKEYQLLVEQLADLALHKGVAAAVAAARGKDPIILDMLHDAMAGKLYNLMHERGLI
jgi:hypothetical protein